MHSEDLRFSEFRLPGPSRKLGRADDLGTARLLDIILATACLVFLAPLMILIAVLIRVVDGAPPIFSHTRIGKNGRLFQCLKFRSMCIDADDKLNALLRSDPVARRAWELNHKLNGDPRVTALGGFLRRSSLDELPQFINVLRGEMSLVGPRPIVASEIARYGRYFEHYCRVRPGITGLWQVSGRSDVSYRRRVAMDVLFIRRRSFWLHLKICLLTQPANRTLELFASQGSETVRRG